MPMEFFQHPPVNRRIAVRWIHDIPVAAEYLRQKGHDIICDKPKFGHRTQCLKIMEPVKFEETLNHITGVVTNGLFARRPADVLILGTPDGAKTILP